MHNTSSGSDRISRRQNSCRMLKKARHLTRPNPGAPRRALSQARPQQTSALQEVGGMILTARVERAHSYRARSASKGIVPAASFPFFSILLENQHRIAIAVEAIPLANRLCIGLSKIFGPNQRGNQHQQCGAWQVKIREESIDDLE